MKILIDSETSMPEAWVCEVCGEIHTPSLSREKMKPGYELAEDCCDPVKSKDHPTCNICGHMYIENHKTACDECMERKSLRGMEIVERDKEKHGVFCGHDNDFYKDIDALICNYDSSINGEIPFYCHPGKPFTASVDACEIIEHIAYWHHHSATENIDTESLQDALNEWLKANPITSIQSIDNQIIILDKVRFDKFMKGPLRRTIAQCFADGVIFFDVRLHKGALPILEGEEKKVHEIVSAKAKHGYGYEVLLVPGILQGNSPDDDLNALRNFCMFCQLGAK